MWCFILMLEMFFFKFIIDSTSFELLNLNCFSRLYLSRVHRRWFYLLPIHLPIRRTLSRWIPLVLVLNNKLQLIQISRQVHLFVYIACCPTWYRASRQLKMVETQFEIQACIISILFWIHICLFNYHILKMHLESLTQLDKNNIYADIIIAKIPKWNLFVRNIPLFDPAYAK